MRAIVQHRYGPPQEVLELKDVDEPAVEAHEVLVRVQAASVNPADWHLIRGDPYIARLSFGLRGPKDAVPGCDLAGRIEAVGANATSFKPGDEVFGSPFMRGHGAFAEHAAVAADVLALKPANLSFDHAATVPLAALTALQGLRDHGRMEPGRKVLIIGASGGVGTYAVQIGKFLGAEVTGVCSTRNVEMLRSIGADHVIPGGRTRARKGRHHGPDSAAGVVSADVTLRRAVPADAEAIGQLLHDFNNEFGEFTPGSDALARRIGELLAAGEITVLLVGEGPEGLALLRFRPSLWTETLDCYLEELYVVPARRGQGLGRALMEAALDAARGAGAAHMDLGTAETDTVARALYESLGFSNREGKPDGPLNFFYEREL